MLNEGQIERIEELAQLNLTPEEKEELKTDLENILDHFEKLDELDTEDVQPLMHVLDLKNVLRDDEKEPSVSRETALKNAPSKSEGFFQVPKVVDKSKKEEA